MSILRVILAMVFGMGLLEAIQAADLYVTTNGTGDGSSWASPTNSIQGAINAISDAYTTNTVWVSNGVYATGGVQGYPAGTSLTNRVAINKAITVRSANNDPANTTIMGYRDPNTNGSVRCLYMASGASLIGFTLTHGATLTGAKNDRRGGGVNCADTSATISNCVIAGNWSDSYGGGAFYGTFFDCMFVGNNAAQTGGGAASFAKLVRCGLFGNLTGGYGAGTYDCVLEQCTITGNTSGWAAGAAYMGALIDCVVSNNSAQMWGAVQLVVASNCVIVGNSISAWGGGGARESTLYNCLIAGNHGDLGGGASMGTQYNCTIVGNSSGSTGGGCDGSVLYNCTIVSNYSLNEGGGVNACSLYNCLLTGNVSTNYDGGGANGSKLYNCTVTGNSAKRNGGGVWGSTSVNSIIYFNSAGGSGSNWYSSVFSNSCTAPSTTVWAAGNTTNNPMFIANGSGYGTNNAMGNYRLIKGSPCINAGLYQSWMTNALDLGGRPRVRYGGVDMGCYEYFPKGAIFGAY